MRSFTVNRVKFFLLIGINDLFSNQIYVGELHRNILHIISKIVIKNPKTKFLVNTILPTSEHKFINNSTKLNILIKKPEKSSSYKLTDINSLFVTKNIKMKMFYSTDTRLNKKGYALCCLELNKSVWVN